MMNLSDILNQMHTLANPASVPGMEHFGISGDNRLGISIPKLRTLAKQVGKDHALALDLWNTAIPEARLLATMIDDPALATPTQMDGWVSQITSWDICDGACNNLFVKTPFAWKKVFQWAEEEPEFTRRAGYVLIACLATHDKKAPDQKFIDTFPLITNYTTDPRNFVRKAVNWAIRGIGKRNLALNHAAIIFSKEIHAIDNKTAHWIATDAQRELISEKVQERLHKKAIN